MIDYTRNMIDYTRNMIDYTRNMIEDFLRKYTKAFDILYF